MENRLDTSVHAHIWRFDPNHYFKWNQLRKRLFLPQKACVQAVAGERCRRKSGGGYTPQMCGARVGRSGGLRKGYFTPVHVVRYI
ncbi:hypothetical protein GCM10010971_38440 [Silvimonas amylolytica]|uniref:Uncharacterized protein n=1 Tax=Silvimonas amylolytica TaxID=449663 RepID=A0ABQ2PQW6_9NEIS|nr:hypothetical protein GCM10010971_38440 [Silvimonas amylolytica]